MNDTGVGKPPFHPTGSCAPRDAKGNAVTDAPIALDSRRTAADRRRTEMRRRPAKDQSFTAPSGEPQPGSLEGQMLAEPARTWVEVMEKWRFLLDRYLVTLDTSDERTRRLVERAIGDMERLRRREERK